MDESPLELHHGQAAGQAVLQPEEDPYQEEPSWNSRKQRDLASRSWNGGYSPSNLGLRFTNGLLLLLMMMKRVFIFISFNFCFALPDFLIL